MEMIEISKLIQHPRNKEFFDDIEGEPWNSFIESVVRRGIVEPIVIVKDSKTGKYIIVSGHQRVRACIELGILEIPCIIMYYPEYDERFKRTKEDMILEDLICTNIMQRGVGNVNPMKMAKCIMELERIKGISHGGDRKSNQDYLDLITQKDLAEELKISQQQLGDYKKLTTLIPELQQMVENGSMKATVGYKIWAKMPQDEQEKFFEQIGREKIKTLTQKATQEIMDKYSKEKQDLENENEKLKVKLENESNKPQKTIEIDNTDYSKIERLNKELESKTKLYNIAKEKEEVYKNQLKLYQEDSQKYKDLTRQIENLTKEKDSIGRAVTSATELSGYIYEVENFLKTKLAPVTYSRALLDCKDNQVVIENVTEIIECVEKWCVETRKNLPNNQKNIINIDIMGEN